MNEFCADFGITQTKDERYLKYDNVNIKFDLKNAREHYIFLTELKHHHEQQRLLLENIEQSEKQSSGHSRTASFCDAFEQLLNEKLVVPEEESEHHRQGIRSKWTQMDTEFNDMFKELNERVNSAITEQDLQVLALYLKKHRSRWESKWDRYGRTIIHAVVEDKSSKLLKCLITAGCNIDEMEGCGATPLTLAVCNNEKNIVELLCSNDALVEKRFYFAIPDPITIAEQLGYDDIHEVLLAADAPSAEDHKTKASLFMIPSSSTAPLKQKEKEDEELEVSDTFS